MFKTVHINIHLLTSLFAFITINQEKSRLQCFQKSHLLKDVRFKIFYWVNTQVPKFKIKFRWSAITLFALHVATRVNYWVSKPFPELKISVNFNSYFDACFKATMRIQSYKNIKFEEFIKWRKKFKKIK